MAYHNSYFDDGNGPIVYSNMGCGAFEQSLSECDKDTYYDFTCSREHTAGVLCGQG